MAILSLSELGLHFSFLFVEVGFILVVDVPFGGRLSVIVRSFIWMFTCLNCSFRLNGGSLLALLGDDCGMCGCDGELIICWLSG